MPQGKLFPEVHIRGDKDVRFEAVGKVIAVCQQVGIHEGGLPYPAAAERSPQPSSVSIEVLLKR